MSHSSGEVNFTSASSHVPPHPEPLPNLFQTAVNSEVVPSGLLSVPLMVCVFPSSEIVWVIELRTLPSFLMTIFQLFVPSGAIDMVRPKWTGWSVPSYVILSTRLPTVHSYLSPPRSLIFIWSPVNWLFSMLSFHFPQKASSAAQSVPVSRQTSASEEQILFNIGASAPGIIEQTYSYVHKGIRA